MLQLHFSCLGKGMIASKKGKEPQVFDSVSNDKWDRTDVRKR